MVNERGVHAAKQFGRCWRSQNVPNTEREVRENFTVAKVQILSGYEHMRDTVRLCDGVDKAFARCREE